MTSLQNIRIRQGGNMETLRSKKGFICDMDGVIYHGNKLLDGVKEFVEWLQREDKRFLFLTNASSRSPRELHEKLLRMGASRLVSMDLPFGPANAL